MLRRFRRSFSGILEVPGVLCLMASALFLPALATADPGGATAEGSTAQRARGHLGVSWVYEEDGGRGRYRVTDLELGSPAEMGGLQVGDLVVAVNDVPFKFSSELEQFEAFLWLEPEDVVAFDVLRDGQAVTVEVKAGTMDPEIQQRWDQVIRAERNTEAIKALRMLGSGSGPALRVQRDGDGVLAFSAEGFPSTTFRHLESYLRSTWVTDQALDLLKPGDHFMLRLETQGPRINMHFEDTPEYIEGPLSEAIKQAGGRSVN